MQSGSPAAVAKDNPAYRRSSGNLLHRTIRRLDGLAATSVACACGLDSASKRRNKPHQGSAVTARPQFKLPAQWEDWGDWIFGLWLLLSPWVLRFESDPTATVGTVMAGILVIRTEVVILTLFRWWEEWVNFALGVCVAVSPWVLGMDDQKPQANLAIVGTLIAALALYEVRSSRQRAT